MNLMGLMDIDLLVFQIRDVITIIVGVASLMGFYFALKQDIAKLRKDVDFLKSKQNEEILGLMKTLEKYEDELEKREREINKKISEAREEQKTSHEKLERKVDKIHQDISKINNNLSELTGYLRAKENH